jgi:hypothetical protein
VCGDKDDGRAPACVREGRNGWAIGGEGWRKELDIVNSGWDVSGARG